MAEELPELLCAMCGNNANQRCTGCYVTFYCCKEHQKLHWKKHKANCSAYKIGSNEELGRYLYATRDLKPGELILMESPLVYAPVAPKQTTCIGCYKTHDGRYRCTVCGWFLCSAKCQASICHQPECNLTSQAGKVKKMKPNDLLKLDAFYELIPVMRGLALKEVRKDKFAFLMALASHDESRKRSGRIDRDQMVLKVLRQIIGLSKELYTDEEILGLCGVLFINAHESPVNSSPCIGLFENISYLEHNCLANASKHFDMNAILSIRAAVPIKKGEHIAIMYSDPLWGTANRHHHLQETKYFNCGCARCQDPTEFGTFFSSIRCQGCPGSAAASAAAAPATNSSKPQSPPAKGYLTPLDPLKEDTLWKCQLCGRQESKDYVASVITAIGEELVKLEKGNEEACKSFIIKHSQNLHPNHFYLIDVKLALCQMLGKRYQDPDQPSAEIRPKRNKDGVKEKELVLKQKLCLEILDVVNKLSPGISRLRGVVLYELQSTLATYARRKYTKGEISLQHLRNIMMEVVQYLRECIQIFSYEPACLQEGRLTAVARLDLVEVETFLDSINSESAPNGADKK